MDADEIRKAVSPEWNENKPLSDWTDWSDAAKITVLAEIAAQLAELNKHLRRRG